MQIIGDLDNPRTPAGEAMGDYFRGLSKITPELRQTFRTNVLNATADDLKKVYDKYLLKGGFSCALTSKEFVKKDRMDGFKIFEI